MQTWRRGAQDSSGTQNVGEPIPQTWSLDQSTDRRAQPRCNPGSAGGSIVGSGDRGSGGGREH